VRRVRSSKARKELIDSAATNAAPELMSTIWNGACFANGAALARWFCDVGSGWVSFGGG
jgi:hypothetical protein